ncbi:related to DOP1-strong similarity to developmental regulatory gene, dopey (dopA) [Sporisorium reilianum SRZ2]|uniref:Related to DOP1-strong similarity to developmental regulatory gene, dopey (DopA) n=1 Tax=Sporisorium reilianum (strain SRZ2) TaxID=999809 RepID=E6ZNU3_SPORE|nr:related to DOP1-strong similarity to developmental regulatory gene, dopey (dopA) [Sporisorium reilianum SRZ2]
MSSPIERVSSNDSASLRAPRRAGGSSTSLSSLPSRLAPPPTLKPSSAEVQLDLSSASSEPRASSSARKVSQGERPKSILPTVQPSGSITTVSPKARPRTSIIESSQLWKTSAAKRAERSWALQTERSLYSDSKFKKYVALVERTLASFDNVSEWADFISFLARLHKATQAYPNYNAIPRKLIVAKRLAQCLNPALPSGVHQRALDVYHHILSVIGPDGLRRDLQVWTSGLLPFFQYASTSVKPTLIAIYETFYLPLQDDLRPLTKALQMALLPGLEEETSEYYERTIRLLDGISNAVTQPFFLQNLWLTLITTPSVRLAALNYLTRRMPPVQDAQDPTLLVGKDLGLMVRGLAHALDDDVLLVRRNTLEILVTHLQIDKPAFKSFVKPPDQILLVRSALNVVLRKDLSLNRRLYTWLLGADETPEVQIAFLRQHGLELVRSALKQGFDDDNLDLADRQKSYRIFVSLLDKWEIGQSLTRVLALDAFHAISLQVARGQQEELMTTAKMLFEVVDPFLLYGRCLEAITAQFHPKASSSLDDSATRSSDSMLALLCFIFKAFHIHDEETKQIHVPLLFAAVAQLLLEQLQRSDVDGEAATLRALDALELLKLLVTVMPSRVFVRIASASSPENVASTDFLERARNFYATSETDSQQAARNFLSFQDSASATALVELLSNVCLESGRRAKEAAARTEVFVRALDIFADVMRVIDGSEAAEEIALVTSAPSPNEPASTQKLPWDAASWTSTLLPFLDLATSFAEVERIVEVLISCCICRALQRPIQLDAPQILDRIVASLLRYLAPAMSPYHVRAVELLWATCKVTQRSRLETAMAQQLTRGTETARSAALAAFGTFWRLSEDVSTDELRTPLLLVLDKLQSLDAEERQQAGIWLRSNLRSYLKVVDPLLHILLRNRPIPLPSASIDVFGIRVVFPEIDEPLNLQLIQYALRTLSSLAQFGGPSFSKALAATPLSASLSTATKQLIRAEKVGASATYLDALLDECAVWVGAQASTQLQDSYSSALTATRADAVELVQCFVQRNHCPRERVQQLETLFIEALLISVRQGIISIQNKMLHTLHSILATKTSLQGRPDLLQRRFSSTSHSQRIHQRDESVGRSEAGAVGDSPVLNQKPASSTVSVSTNVAKQPHRLLLPLLHRGLVTASNRPVLQLWSDFILMTAPLYRSSAALLLLRLNQTACDMIAKAMLEVSGSYVPAASRPTFGAELVVQAHDAQCSFLESDVLLLINLAERLLILASSSAGSEGVGATASRSAAAEDAANVESSSIVNEKATQEHGAPGLLGYVSNVFSSDAGDADGSDTPREGRTYNLSHTIQTLHRVWTVCNAELSHTDAKSLSLDALSSKVELRCRRAFERIYRAHPAETIESLLHCWHTSVKSGRSRNEASTRAVIEILDIVTPSAQILVTFLCDVLKARIARSDSDRARKNGNSSAGAVVSDATYFLFFHTVLARMEPQEATQVWPVVIVFVKDFVANGMARKVHVYPMLRIFTALAEKICLTAAIEDRRTKRDLQDNFGKLIDSCILISGRSFDQSTWIRRSGRDNAEDLDKEASEFASELLLLEDEKRVVLSTDGGAAAGVIDAINEFLATRGLAALRKIQMDTDRIQAIVANAVYYIVAPAARTRSRTLEVDASVLAVISELVRMPGTVKAWRSTVADIFGDGRFFSMPLAKARCWQPIILALMTQDKERVVDLLARVSASAGAANIFANRELEMLSRALNLRRLSFTIFAGEQDAFLTQLPLIQEKLVDLLRSAVSEVLHAEVYLCLRVLLVRYSARNLASFWPVLMTELMRLYDQVATEPESMQQSADGRNLLLSTLKLLDLLVLIQPEDFQINEWLFVTDTIDAVYPADDFQPETLLDSLSTTFSKQGKGASSHSRTAAAAVGSSGLKRRLQIGRLRTVSSVAELVPFLNSVSQNAFEGNYSDKPIDFEDVDMCLLADMFDSDAAANGQQQLTVDGGAAVGV